MIAKHIEMIACFIAKSGHVVTIPLENRHAVNTEWYATICLSEVMSGGKTTQKVKSFITIMLNPILLILNRFLVSN